ncbi:MAG: hypothetical protein NVSMB3_03770 [Acidobacteriaceae bacterium]
MKLFSLTSRLTRSALSCSLALGTLAFGHAAVAQSPTLHLVARVPFAFRSGSTVMPAGEYHITRLSDHILLLRGASQARSQIMAVSSAFSLKQPDHGKLVFHRYGNQYFLYQVWSGARADGFELPKSHSEKEMLRAQNKPAPSNSEIALNEPPLR